MRGKRKLKGHYLFIFLIPKEPLVSHGALFPKLLARDTRLRLDFWSPGSYITLTNGQHNPLGKSHIKLLLFEVSPLYCVAISL